MVSKQNQKYKANLNYKKEAAVVKMEMLHRQVNYYILKTVCELKVNPKIIQMKNRHQKVQHKTSLVAGDGSGAKSTGCSFKVPGFGS